MLPLFPRKRNSVTVQAATQVKREKKLNAATRCFETASRCRLSFRTQGRKRRISQLHPKRNLTNKLFFFFSLQKKQTDISSCPVLFCLSAPNKPKGQGASIFAPQHGEGRRTSTAAYPSTVGVYSSFGSAASSRSATTAPTHFRPPATPSAATTSSSVLSYCRRPAVYSSTTTTSFHLRCVSSSAAAYYRRGN